MTEYLERDDGSKMPVGQHLKKSESFARPGPGGFTHTRTVLHSAVDDLREAIRFLEGTEPGYDDKDRTEHAKTLLTDVRMKCSQSIARIKEREADGL